MSFQTLISASELDHLCRTETDVVILDARFHLDDEDWGDRAFAESHIPGAQRASLATDLSGPIIEGVTGRRPFPRPQTSSALFDRGASGRQLRWSSTTPIAG